MNTNASASDLEGLVSVIALIACVSVVLPFQAAVLPVFAMCAVQLHCSSSTRWAWPAWAGPLAAFRAESTCSVTHRDVTSPFKGEIASFIRLSTKPL